MTGGEKNPMSWCSLEFILSQQHGSLREEQNEAQQHSSRPSMYNQAMLSIPINFTAITTLFLSGTTEDGKLLYFMDSKINTNSVMLVLTDAAMFCSKW